jgi:hypothetical protein
MILIMAQGAISYLLLNGWKWSPIGEPLSPSSTIGLEQVRASLFEQGLMLTEGYTNLILGPLISQMLWLGSLFERLSAPYVDYPWLTSRVTLSMISLIGMMWGCSLLFKRRVLTVAAGILAIAAITTTLQSSAEALWMLTVYTWIGVGFTASWRHSASGRWAVLCGFTLSVGIAATPLFAPLAILYVLLTLLPLPLGPSVPWWRAIAWRTPLGAIFGLGIGIAPWLFRGQLSHPPITLEQYASSSVWISLWDSLDFWHIIEETQAIFAPLWLMACLTFMSSHISGAPWSRRGMGLTGLLALGLIYAPLLGFTLVIPPLVWIIVHPWSPVGTFALLSFKPFFKKMISLALFILALLIPTTHSLQQFQERQTALKTPASQERSLVANYLNNHKGLKSIWALGHESHALYAMTDLRTSALLPLGLDPIRLSQISQVIADEKIDVIIAGSSAKRAMSRDRFKDLLKHKYRLLPASDYQWLDTAQLQVYLRLGAIKSQPQSTQPQAQPQPKLRSPRPLSPQESQVIPRPSNLNLGSKSTDSISKRLSKDQPDLARQQDVKTPPIKIPQALPVQALPQSPKTSDQDDQAKPQETNLQDDQLEKSAADPKESAAKPKNKESAAKPKNKKSAAKPKNKKSAARPKPGSQ